MPGAQALAPKKALVANWLSGAALAERLEVVKLRRAPHPDPARKDAPGVRLELLYRTDERDEAKIEQDFVAFMTAQTDREGQPFAERTFYKATHLLGLPREDVSVHFHVSESEYVVFFDARQRKVVTQRAVKRGAIRRTVSINRPPARAVKTTTVSGGADRALASSVRSFFERSWSAVAPPQGAPPVILTFEPLETDYVAFSVEGFKKQIVRGNNYWEKLQVSIEVNPTDAGWKLTCYFDGQYAAGLGPRKPADDGYSDMDGAHRADLNAYASNVLTRLQQHLEDGR